MKCKVYTIEGAENVRDIGGYTGSGGKKIQYGRFIRSASLSAITGAGKQALHALGISAMVDLRSSMEVRAAPNPMKNDPGISYHHIPMLDYIQSSIADADASMFPASMSQMYAGLLDNGSEDFRRVFEIFSADHEAILYHCTAGKDRTGVTTMLLLDLAGVDDGTIVEDYTVTQLISAPFRRPPGLPAYLFEARAETMIDTLAYLRKTWRNAEGYLAQAGLSAAAVDAVRSRLFL